MYQCQILSAYQDEGPEKVNGWFGDAQVFASTDSIRKSRLRADCMIVDHGSSRTPPASIVGSKAVLPLEAHRYQTTGSSVPAVSPAPCRSGPTWRALCEHHLYLMHCMLHQVHAAFFRSSRPLSQGDRLFDRVIELGRHLHSKAVMLKIAAILCTTFRQLTLRSTPWSAAERSDR